MQWIRIFLIGLAALAAAPALAERDSAKSYIFGNSLINHLSDSPGTAVPYWLGQLARADDKSFARAGQWGFLRDFADLPPKPNWSFPGVTSAGTPRTGAGFDAVMINPANFIQYQAPDAPYEGDNPDAQSPLYATLKVLDWTQEAWTGRAGGYLDANGSPLAIPEGARALQAFILTDQPTGASHLNGRYLLRYDGEGVIRVTGRADNLRYNYTARGPL